MDGRRRSVTGFSEGRISRLEHIRCSPVHEIAERRRRSFWYPPCDLTRFWLVAPCWCISCNPNGHDFSPGSFQVSGNPAGGSASRVSRYASARKSQRLLFYTNAFVLVRTIFFFSFFSWFLVFFSFQHVTNSFCKRARLFWNRTRWSFFLPIRGDVLLTGIKYFQQERSLDELPPRVMSLPWLLISLEGATCRGEACLPHREYTLQL